MIFRFFVSKRAGMCEESDRLAHELTHFLGITRLTALQIYHGYELEGISPEIAQKAAGSVLSDPACDVCYSESFPLPEGARVLAYAALPGQYDQRADSCAQCVELLCGVRPVVRCMRVLVMEGISEEDIPAIRRYVINPVENEEITLAKPDTLSPALTPPGEVPVLSGFLEAEDAALAGFIETYGFAMDEADLLCVRDFFRSEKREPTLAEIKVIDTYWSDHCRHTTFSTYLENIRIEDPRVKRAWQSFQKAFGQTEVTLMDLATMGGKWLKKQGKLPHLDESDEVNACSLKVMANIDGVPTPYLLQFKNETHNHPTEIEPFGGAATCIGGAIRDPLAGRAYVYQSMRITGAGDPRMDIAQTLPGKLPQRKLTQTAAAGFSSYGNQIGLATGLVREVYHPGYQAKRMELGAVVGAVPQAQVRRLAPVPGDVVLLLGGRTGRDGIGGATGSSKTHHAGSVRDCAAEVQKGNAPEERKLQRLFRNPEATLKIKRCNDFGAGGVCVAVGELAPGLVIDLDKVPCKYDGLDGTELAISESQERMAVVVAPEDASAFIQLAEAENLEATPLALVTQTPRLIMRWRGKEIINLHRSFLDTNGASRRAEVFVPLRTEKQPHKDGKSLAESILCMAAELNFCSQRGLGERFDGSIGAGTVLMPFGGEYQLTPAPVCAALLPAAEGETDTCSLMSYAFDPDAAGQDPFGAARDAVILSAARLVAAGGDLQNAALSFQEFYPRLRNDPARWGLPFAALLGAWEAQLALGIAAIGGKDSMSGSFEDMDVPPTLVSIAVTTAKAGEVLSPEWKKTDSWVVFHEAPSEPAQLRAFWTQFSEAVRQGKVRSAYAVGPQGVAGALIHMCMGNQIGFASQIQGFDWLDARTGSLVAEWDAPPDRGLVLGRTTQKAELVVDKNIIPLPSLRAAWEKPLESIFPTGADVSGPAPALAFARRCETKPVLRTPMPTVLIPVFPGTNCETDTARAFRLAGARTEQVVVRNMTPAVLQDSVLAMEKALRECQILAIPGGFSAGDEPDGSGKFIATFFRNPALMDAVMALLTERDGLILGICNGFQALVKLGLLPCGEIRQPDADSPALTVNAIGRHQSKYVYTRTSSVLSPWLAQCAPGDVHRIPVSHGEGRFIASEDMLEKLSQNGQIAFQYCGADGQPAMDIDVNPNGSMWAVEGITSPCGRVLGKMGHSERVGPFVARNVPNVRPQPIFESGVRYFRG